MDAIVIFHVLFHFELDLDLAYNTQSFGYYWYPYLSKHMDFSFLAHRYYVRTYALFRVSLKIVMLSNKKE